MAVKEGDEARKAVGRIEDPAERFSAFMALYKDRVRMAPAFLRAMTAADRSKD